MPDTFSAEGHPARHVRHNPSRMLPGSGLAWTAIALTVAVPPVAWTLMSHAIPIAILDTWVAPVSLWALLVAAAATGLAALILKRDTSVPVIVALAFSVPTAAFATLILIGEILFPH